MSEIDKAKLINELVDRTGLNRRRCENYLERFNWNMEKVLEYPPIKSNLRQDTPLFSFEDEEVVQVPTPVKRTRRTKKKEETEKKVEIIPQTQVSTDDPKKVTKDTKYFRGKFIHNDESGLYGPFLSMEEINEWTHKYIKKRQY